MADFVSCRMAKNHRHRGSSSSSQLLSAVIKDTGTTWSSFFGLGGETQCAISELCSRGCGDRHQSQDEIRWLGRLFTNGRNELSF
jgi:hypothetical protein